MMDNNKRALFNADTTSESHFQENLMTAPSKVGYD